MTALGTIVGGRYTALLVAIGVCTVEELAARHSTLLIARLHHANDALRLVRLVPSGLRIATWVHQARSLCRATTHLTPRRTVRAFERKEHYAQ